MATKIKEILGLVPQDSVLFSSWLSSQGIDRKEQTQYVRSGWLERIATGVYKIDGYAPTLYGAVASFNSQLGKRCHVGASSALDLRGYSHFVAMGKPLAFLFTANGSRLPRWMLNSEWDMTIKYFTTSIFKEDVGLEKYEYRGSQLLISKGSTRQVTLHEDVIKCLNELKEYYKNMIDFNDDWFVFGGLKPLAPTTIGRKRDMYCKKSGVKKIRIHDFRHSHASLLISKGVPITMVSKRLGHSNIEMTFNTYAHLIPEDEDKAINALENLSSIY